MLLHNLKISLRKNKLLYYISNIVKQAAPTVLHRRMLTKKITLISKYPKDDVLFRLEYYNKLSEFMKLGDNAVSLSDVKRIKAASAYIFDTLKYSRYFPQTLKANFIFGDVIHTCLEPAIQKSRPIDGDNRNAILLNLDKKRHFLFLHDPIPFEKKINKLIGRGSITQPHRIRFFDQYFRNPKVDIGQVNKVGGRQEWIKPKITLMEHLKYKFILSLEGNDVATNLKWIMSSNSIAVMPAPKYETWFMEGRLIPNYHYILIQDDYSDLDAQLAYYSTNEEAARQIVKNANIYVEQFQDQDMEDLLSILVLEKYFYWTKQVQQISI